MQKSSVLKLFDDEMFLYAAHMTGVKWQPNKVIAEIVDCTNDSQILQIWL